MGAEERDQKKKGGVSLGCLLLVGVMVVLVAGMLLPTHCGSGGKARRINCAGNLKQIGLALIIYAGDDPDDGYFPDGISFQRLHEGRYLTDGKVYSCPEAIALDTLAGQSNYVYRGAGLKDTHANSTKVILAHDRLGNHEGWVNCLYLDGHVKGSKSKAKNWDEFRKEKEAAGDILP